MKNADIDRFFEALSKEVLFPVTITLTGDAVAMLKGGARMTKDLDFQITLAGTFEQREAVEAALLKVSQSTSIPVQYDEAIETWSSIAWPRQRGRSRLYKRYKTVRVYILNPLLWSIGKLARYLKSDEEDLALVFKHEKIPLKKALLAWGNALGQSPMSSMQPLFKHHVIEFLSREGPSLWGKDFDLAQAQATFLNAAQNSYRTKQKRQK